MLIELMRWWYGPGWLEAWKSAGNWIVNVQRAFSVGVLLKTLFSPWKRIVALPGRSLDEKIRGMVDNLVSRAVGFFARLSVLLAATALISFTAVTGLVMAVSWPFLPLLFLYLIFRAVIG